MRIGIIAALPGELKPLVRGWVKLPVAKRSGIYMWQTSLRENEVIAVCAGIGAAAALRAFTAAEHAGSLDLVLSVGWAGALRPELSGGTTWVASKIVDARTGEQFLLARNRSDCTLVTTPKVADGGEKRRLRETYNAALVDMEAATVARLAQMRDIPVVCLKAISDEADEGGPDLNPFIDTVSGKLRTANLVAKSLMHPAWWGPLMRVGRNSEAGAKSLASAVLTFLTGPGDVRALNESGNVDW